MRLKSPTATDAIAQGLPFGRTLSRGLPLLIALLGPSGDVET